METNQLIPKKIEDCEILAELVRVYPKHTFGPKKYKRDIMLSFGHNHHSNDELGGTVDVFLTNQQALTIIKELSSTILINQLSNK